MQLMKIHFNFTRTILLLVLVFAVHLTSCKKDDNDSGAPINPTGSTYKTTVTGKVTDVNGLVVSGVTVKLGTKTATTDGRGYFVFVNAEIPKDRMVIKGTKSGYFDCVKAKRSQSGAANYINLVMQELPVAINVNGAAGGVVNLAGGARITFPANAFVDAAGNAYTGVVKIYARHFNPAADGFEAIIPGGDLIGTNVAGQTQSLYSLGMIEALLKDNAGINEVKLAAGITAQLRFPIDASQLSSAQTTVPLWSMNANTGIWKEEGSATKNGNYFEGSVSHFSTWNCDYNGPRCDITGKVVDCQNNPMSGVVVTINGFMNVITDNTGAFSTWVPVGYLITCQALQANNPILTSDSQVQSITAATGQNIIPTISINCATRIIGSVIACGTGTLASGFVYVSWNGGSSVQYTADGIYRMMMPINTPVIVEVNSSGYSGSRSFVTGALNSTDTVPQIQLCEVVSVKPISFQLNTGGNTTNFIMSNTSSNSNFVDSNSDGIFESATIVITGKANPGNYDCTITMHANQRVSDYYPLGINMQNNITIAMDSIWYYGSGLPQTVTTNKLIFTDYGAPGGIAAGRFEYDTGSGTIKEGVFSVIRNN
jgi:hypothetical protein